MRTDSIELEKNLYLVSERIMTVIDHVTPVTSKGDQSPIQIWSFQNITLPFHVLLK